MDRQACTSGSQDKAKDIDFQLHGYRKKIKTVLLLKNVAGSSLRGFLPRRYYYYPSTNKRSLYNAKSVASPNMWVGQNV